MSGKILLVHAGAPVSDALHDRLVENYYQVSTDTMPEAAIATAQELRPDLVLICQNPGASLRGSQLRNFALDPKLLSSVILVIHHDDLSTQERLRLIKAGAEDVIEHDSGLDLLMARLRALRRRSAEASGNRQAQKLRKQLAMNDAPRRFDPQGSVMIATPDTETAALWQTQLRHTLAATLQCSSIKASLSGLARHPAPDVYAVGCTTSPRDPGMQLISELNSRPDSRDAAVIAILLDTGTSRATRCERAAMALDIGAEDVMLSGFDKTEFSMRAIRQMAHKKQADYRRQLVSSGLKMAVTDSLTGLYNRRYALSHLAEISNEAWAEGLPITTMVLDLDRFKQINDSYGHGAGDQVLMNVAARLQRSLRANDLVARLGGEEFLVAMPGADHAIARDTAERLRRLIGKASISLPGITETIRITCSIGVYVHSPHDPNALTDPGPPDVKDLIHNADTALYTSKACGRDKVSFAAGLAAQ